MTTGYHIYDRTDTVSHIPDCGRCGETDCPDCGTFSMLPPDISLPDTVDQAGILAMQARQLAEHCREQSAGIGLRNHTAGNLAEAAARSLEQAADYLNSALLATDDEF